MVPKSLSDALYPATQECIESEQEVDSDGEVDVFDKFRDRVCIKGGDHEALSDAGYPCLHQRPGLTEARYCCIATFDTRLATLGVFRVQRRICIGFNPPGEGGPEVSLSGRGTEWAGRGGRCFTQRGDTDEPERLISSAGSDGDGITGPAKPHCDFPVNPLGDRCH